MQLGLIGYPLGHSKSPEIFAQLFAQKNIKGSYTLHPLKNIALLKQWLPTQPNLLGFNVTIPYKQSIIPFLDEISNEAKAIGAVNTVKITRTNGGIQLYGYNTDYWGFTTSLLSFLGDEIPTKALLLGTGGSAKAVSYALQTLGIAVTKVSRTKNSDILSYDEADAEIIRQHRLLINTTPLGMYPNINSFPAINYEAITPKHYLFDLVYNPAETPFLLKGKAQGAATKNGFEMLHLQAQKAFEIWCN